MTTAKRSTRILHGAFHDERRKREQGWVFFCADTFGNALSALAAMFQVYEAGPVGGMLTHSPVLIFTY